MAISRRCRLLPAVTALTLDGCQIPSFEALPKLSQLRSLVFKPEYPHPFNAKLEHMVACKSLTSVRLGDCSYEDLIRLAPLNVPST